MTDDEIIARMTAEQNAFEQWAQSHGGLSLKPVGTGGGSRNGRFPAIYWNDETEIAWRAWANKAATVAASQPAQGEFANLCKSGVCANSQPAQGERQHSPPSIYKGQTKALAAGHTYIIRQLPNNDG